MAGHETPNAGASPTIFLNYPNARTAEADSLRDFARAKGFAIEPVPFSAEGECDLPALLDKSGATSIVLAVVVSSTTVDNPWINGGLSKALGIKLQSRINATFVLTLDVIPTATIRSKLPRVDERLIVKLVPLDLGAGEFLDKVRTQLKLPAPVREAATPRSGRRSFEFSGALRLGATSIELLSQLKDQISSRDVLDQRYLYWDAASAERWKNVSNLGLYRVGVLSQNLVMTKSADLMKLIVNDSGGRDFTFLNFGVGTGLKDYHFISALAENGRHVSYYAIDDSLPMLELTIRQMTQTTTSDLFTSGRLDFNFILDDFFSIKAGYSHRLDKSPGVRIAGLLGGSLGNFRERGILETMLGVVGDQGYLVVGVEFWEEGSEQSTLGSYTRKEVKEFELGPVMDVLHWRPDLGDEAIANSILHYDFRKWPRNSGHSDVKGSATLIGQARIPEDYRSTRTPLQLFSSTKYNREELETFFTDDLDLEIVGGKPFLSAEEPKRFGKYILKMSPQRRKSQGS